MQDEGGRHMPSATGRLHRSAQEVQGWRSSQVEEPKRGGWERIFWLEKTRNLVTFFCWWEAVCKQGLISVCLSRPQEAW